MLFSLLLFLSSVSSAAEYTVVEVCRQPGSANLTAALEPGSEGFQVLSLCDPTLPGGLGLFAEGRSVRGSVRWTLTAPADTSIHSLEARREPLALDAGFRWEVVKADGTEIEAVNGPAAPPGGPDIFVADSASITARLSCTPARCDGATDHTIGAVVNVTSLAAHVKDDFGPTIGLNPPPPTTPLRGTVRIPYEAEDRGSGVGKAGGMVLALDHDPAGPATAVASDSDDNGGRCKEPFKFMSPCKLRLEGRSFSLDTTRIPDGPHTITPIILDAAGNLANGEAAQILIHNAPTNIERPALTGTARVGEKLSAGNGRWEGASISFAYQWLRCPANVADGSEAGCEPVAGATRSAYTPAPADAGNRLVTRVTATNASGSGATLSTASAPVAEASGGGRGNPPQTMIVKHPRRTTALRGAKLSTARFTFSSDQTGARFECKLDKAPFKPCRSPYTHKVKRGRHSLLVRAVNPAKEADPTPARFSWRVT